MLLGGILVDYVSVLHRSARDTGYGFPETRDTANRRLSLSSLALVSRGFQTVYVSDQSGSRDIQWSLWSGRDIQTVDQSRRGRTTFYFRSHSPVGSLYGICFYKESPVIHTGIFFSPYRTSAVTAVPKVRPLRGIRDRNIILEQVEPKNQHDFYHLPNSATPRPLYLFLCLTSRRGTNFLRRPLRKPHNLTNALLTGC